MQSCVFNRMESFAEERTALALLYAEMAQEGTRKRTELHELQFQTAGIESEPPITAGTWDWLFQLQEIPTVCSSGSFIKHNAQLPEKSCWCLTRTRESFQGQQGFGNERFQAAGLNGKREPFSVASSASSSCSTLLSLLGDNVGRESCSVKQKSSAPVKSLGSCCCCFLSPWQGKGSAGQVALKSFRPGGGDLV